jgi:MHS family proline/betaine transporter-like MFS transporter
LSAAEVRAWGWRLPFIAGLAIAPVGLYLRRSLHETAEFKAENARVPHSKPRAAPLVEVFTQHSRALASGFTVAVLWAVAVYVLMIFLPTYIQRPDTFNFSAKQAFGASLIGNVPFIGACVLFGALSDRIGRRLSLFLSAGLLLTTVLPLFMWLQAQPSFANLLIVQTTLCILVASFVGVAPAALSEIFPTAVRSTGTSLVYNAAFTIFGGFAPMILTWARQGSGGSIFVPAWYVMAAAAVALLAIPLLKETQCSRKLPDSSAIP